MRRRYDGGERVCDIAKSMGSHHSTVTKIVKRRTRNFDKERADIDSLRNNLKDIARSAAMECPACGEIALEAQRIDTTPDGRTDYTVYECSKCGIETSFTGQVWT